jgi:hypothetical protein
MCIGDDEYVTQMSDRDGTFRAEPRLSGETDLSVLRGQLPFDETFRNVARRSPGPSEVDAQSVRYAVAETLRSLGFAVVHTPSRRTKNLLHSSIVWPKDPSEAPKVPWLERQRTALESAFPEEGNTK